MLKPEERNQANEAGMSIIEVLVSMVIMSVVLVGLGQALVLGIRMNVEAKARIANLSVAKRIMETVKSQAQFSQELFDDAGDNETLNKTFYVDANGNETAPSESTSSPSPSASNSIPGDASYQVVVAVTDWSDSEGGTLSAIDSEGESHVMVKVLTVTVQTTQSAVLSNAANKAAAREVRMTVEMVRPAA